MRYSRLADLVLRASVALAFLYPPYAALQDPDGWIGYFPPFVANLGNELYLLHAFGALEVVLALWILSGWRIVYPALAASALLIAIVVFNLPQFEVLFRDLSIALVALALALLHWPRVAVSSATLQE
jgi:hypothetical protein